MTWLQVKQAVEALGVTDETVFSSIVICEGKPVLVVTDPQDAGKKVIKDTY